MTSQTKTAEANRLNYSSAGRIRERVPGERGVFDLEAVRLDASARCDAAFDRVLAAIAGIVRE